MEDPVLAFESAEAWEAWLEERHATADGLWLKIAKKGSGIPTVTYSDAIDVALCFGWIDGQKDRLDDAHWLQRFTPRRARSKWSKINRTRVAELEAQGRMRPAGESEVRRAKDDGRWEAAYDGARTMTVPDDLTSALDANERARDFFAKLDGSNRYAILFRIHDAKRADTRARRIEQYVAMLADGKKLHP